MSYIQKILLSDEKVLYYTKPHYMIFFPTCLWFALASLVSIYSANSIVIFLVLIILVNLTSEILSYYCSEYAITNKRVIMKIGFIHRQSLEIFLDRIEGTYVEQNIAGRILNFGTIIVCGIGGNKSYFSYVPKPIEFNNNIQQTQKIAGR